MLPDDLIEEVSVVSPTQIQPAKPTARQTYKKPELNPVIVPQPKSSADPIYRERFAKLYKLFAQNPDGIPPPPPMDSVFFEVWFDAASAAQAVAMGQTKDPWDTESPDDLELHTSEG